MTLVFSVPDSISMLAEWLKQVPQRVDLWRIDLAAARDRARALRSVLSADERQRALRFATEPLAERYIVCRAATRLILAEYLPRDGAQLEFGCHAMGKPYLAAGHGRRCRLRFNVSHSRDLAMLAVAWRREVGVDIEAVRPVQYLERMVRRCLGPLEQSAFCGAAREEGSELFLRYWTHKEAYLKATGQGLRVPLGTIQVELHEGGPSRILSRPDGQWSCRNSGICLIPIRPGAGYCGALALVGGGQPEIQHQDWHS